MFRQLRKEAEARAEEMKRTKQVGMPVSNILGKKQGQQKKTAGDGSSKKKSDGSEADGGDNGKSYKLQNGHSNGNQTDENAVANGKKNDNSNNGAFDVGKLQKLKAKGGKKSDALSGKGGKKSDTLASNGLKSGPKKKMTKRNRVWDDLPPPAKLDFTDPASEGGEEHIEPITIDQGESMMDKKRLLAVIVSLKKKRKLKRITRLLQRRKGGFHQCSKVLLVRIIWEGRI